MEGWSGNHLILGELCLFMSWNSKSSLWTHLNMDPRVVNMTSFVVGLFAGVAGYRLLTRGKNAAASVAPPHYFTRKSDLIGGMSMVIAVRSDLGMGKGKIAAQCSHAAVACYKQASKMYPKYLDAWEDDGQPKFEKLRIVKLKSEEDLVIVKNATCHRPLPWHVIHDAGRIPSGSATVIGVGPAPYLLVGCSTAHLKCL